MLFHVFNCTTCRLTVFTCRCTNIVDDAELAAVGAPPLSWFWCVRQKLFNLSDIKAGDSAAGDSSSSLGVVGGRGWLLQVELTLEWPSITFLWEHSGYNNTSPPLSSVSSKLWGWQLCFLHSTNRRTEKLWYVINTALGKWNCWFIQAWHVQNHTNVEPMIDSTWFSDSMVDSLHSLPKMGTDIYSHSHAIKVFLHKNGKLIENEICRIRKGRGHGELLFEISIATCVLTPRGSAFLNEAS